jgi:hypothetical protein
MSPFGDGEGRGRLLFLRNNTKRALFCSCHLPGVPRDVGGTSTCARGTTLVAGCVPGHSFGDFAAWAPPTSAYLRTSRFLRRAAPGRVPRWHRRGARTLPHSLPTASRVLLPVIAGLFDCATDASTNAVAVSSSINPPPRESEGTRRSAAARRPGDRRGGIQSRTSHRIRSRATRGRRP